MWFFYLIFSLRELCVPEFFHVVTPQTGNLFKQPINLILQPGDIILLGLDLPQLIQFPLHLQNLNIPGYHFLIHKTISLSQYGKFLLNLPYFLIPLIHLQFRTLNALHNRIIMIFIHMCHMVNILNLLLHVDRYCCYYFLYVLCSVLVMDTHFGVLVKYALRD